jgi:hypothetical protein
LNLGHALERRLRVGISQFTLVKNAQVVINGEQFGSHLLGGRERSESLIQMISLHQRQAEIEIVGGNRFPRSDDLLKFGGGLGIVALLIIGLADVADGLDFDGPKGMGRRGLRLHSDLRSLPGMTVGNQNKDRKSDCACEFSDDQRAISKHVPPRNRLALDRETRKSLYIALPRTAEAECGRTRKGNSGNYFSPA